MKKFWGQIHKHQKVFPDLNVEEFQFKVIFLDPAQKLFINEHLNCVLISSCFKLKFHV